MSSRKAYVRRVHHWLANRGLRGVLKEVWRRLRLRLKGEPSDTVPSPEPGPHPFDLEHGVDTTGLVWGECLPDTSTDEHAKGARYWATGYYGVTPSALIEPMDRLALSWERFTFVDVGCGKGRALLLALRYPFARVLGVELSPALAAVAQANLARFAAPWRKPSVPAEVFCGDAAAFPIPSGPVLLYLYHPFAAPVMRRFLAHVQAALQAEPREIYLLYTNPELRSMLDGTPGVTRLWDHWTRLTESETAADRFGSVEEHTAAFRLVRPG